MEQMSLTQICTVSLASLYMVFLVLLTILSIIDKFSNSTWFCTFLGWHKHINEIGFDECSRTSTCKRCGKSLLQDSQGNWF